MSALLVVAGVGLLAASMVPVALFFAARIFELADDALADLDDEVLS